MKLIFVDGCLAGKTYYLKNENHETCLYCKNCTLNKNPYNYIGRCNLTNLRKFSDEYCDKFIKVREIK